jgi:hypothetical protein
MDWLLNDQHDQLLIELIVWIEKLRAKKVGERRDGYHRGTTNGKVGITALPVSLELLREIDELPDPQNVYEARATKILYALEFEIRVLEERVNELQRRIVGLEKKA